MFRVATFNVCSKPLMSQDKVVADVNTAADKADVILWQEIHPERYKDAVLDLHDRGFKTFMPSMRNGFGDPISWRESKFEYLDGGVEILHDPRPGLGARWITWVLLRRKGTKRKIVFHSVHYVARAWHPDGSARLRKHPEKRAQQPWRQAVWLVGNARHKAFLRRWQRKGILVFGGGDFNRAGKYPVVGTRVRRTKVKYLMQGNLDYIFAVENRWLRVIQETSETYRKNSDHALRVVRVRLRRRLSPRVVFRRRKRN